MVRSPLRGWTSHAKPHQYITVSDPTVETNHQIPAAYLRTVDENKGISPLPGLNTFEMPSISSPPANSPIYLRALIHEPRFLVRDRASGPECWNRLSCFGHDLLVLAVIAGVGDELVEEAGGGV